MMTDDRPTLATLLRGRSRHEIAQFVASLYDARGARVRLDGEIVVVDGERYLVVPAGVVARLRERLTGPPSYTIDAVVTVDADRAEALAARYDAPAITPADLDDIVRYGVDRATADTIVRETLGVGLDSLYPTGWSPESGGTEQSAEPTDATRGGSPPRQDRDPAPVVIPQSAIIGAVLLIGVGAVIVLGPSALGVDAGPLAGIGGAASPTDEQSASTDETETTDVVDATETARPNASADEVFSLAPGLTTDGVTDADALADAHAAFVANHSYRWELTYVEYVNGTERGRLVESVVVESPTRYNSTVRVEGRPASSGPISSGSSYADGDRRYRQTAEGIESQPIAADGVLGRQERRSSRYYEVLFDGQETAHVRTIFGQPRQYVVDIQGAPAFSVRNYTATAHVAPSGFIRYFSGSYCVVSIRGNTEETCVSLTMQYKLTPEATAEPPSWYRTNATTTETETTTATTTETTTTTATTTETTTTTLNTSTATDTGTPSTR